ncbi:Phycocyanin [[Leptolyngbya] sp. PCC 7376]|uniref:phycocyanin n=1 Tax=[Leptolyngbya] sp. PCC 7376 TaxID=111781 RepID=UPI00029F1EF8|nr:phycocyanin [[Leptolyngbya] sp. PCC 7376]AFY38751.1 Phycocyanin [[Leptolyngbya] sp. PCC 7376]
MITLLENLIERSDGSYFESQDLDVVEQSLQSWGDRRGAYQRIQELEADIVTKTLNRFKQDHEPLIRSAPDSILKKCQGDLSLVLRNCAMAMLLQDEELLKDRFLFWMQNIMRALRNQKFNVHIYQILQDIIQEELSPNDATLMLPYLKITYQFLSE